MEVSINGASAKWMVYMETPIELDDLGEHREHPFMETHKSVTIQGLSISVMAQKNHHVVAQKIYTHRYQESIKGSGWHVIFVLGKEAKTK